MEAFTEATHVHFWERRRKSERCAEGIVPLKKNLVGLISMKVNRYLWGSVVLRKLSELFGHVAAKWDVKATGSRPNGAKRNVERRLYSMSARKINSVLRTYIFEVKNRAIGHKVRQCTKESCGVFNRADGPSGTRSHAGTRAVGLQNGSKQFGDQSHSDANGLTNSPSTAGSKARIQRRTLPAVG
jgi:hypothetical protein